jgi:hypothetical protein
MVERAGTGPCPTDATEVIDREARRLADNSSQSYSLILYTGLEAHRNGEDVDYCFQVMEDYVRGKE